MRYDTKDLVIFIYQKDKDRIEADGLTGPDPVCGTFSPCSPSTDGRFRFCRGRACKPSSYGYGFDSYDMDLEERIAELESLASTAEERGEFLATKEETLQSVIKALKEDCKRIAKERLKLNQKNKKKP